MIPSLQGIPACVLVTSAQHRNHNGTLPGECGVSWTEYRAPWTESQALTDGGQQEVNTGTGSKRGRVGRGRDVPGKEPTWRA